MLSSTAFLPLLTFAFVTCMTPGPNNVMLMSSGMNFGFKLSIPHMSGVMVGRPVVIVLVGIGLLKLFEQAPHSFLVLKLVSVCYILYLTWRIAFTKTLCSESNPTKPLRFIQAALFQWVNPMAWVMASYAFTLYTPKSSSLNSVFVVAMVFVVSGTLATFLWTALGHQLKRYFSNPIRLRVANVVLAMLLLSTLLPMLSHLDTSYF